MCPAILVFCIMFKKVLCVFSGAQLDGLFNWIGQILPDCRMTPVTYLKGHQSGDLVFEDFMSPGSLLRHVKPDLILFRSISSYHEIALNQCAQKKGIPTVLIGHGDMPPLSAQNMISVNKPSTNDRVERLRHVLNFYFLSAPISCWADRFKYLMAARNTGNPYLAAKAPKRPLHLANKALVLNEEAEETMIRHYGYAHEDVVVMGDPQGENIKDVSISQGYVLFVDTDLSSLKELLEDVYDPWYELFSHLFCILPPEASILIRLHPQTPADKYLFVQNIPGVSISYDRSVAEDLSGAALVCGFRSTLLSLALAMDKPVLLADNWDTYFPAFPPIADGLYIKTSDIHDKLTPSPWPKPSTLDPVRLDMYKKIRGFGLPSRKIALDVLASLKKK